MSIEVDPIAQWAEKTPDREALRTANGPVTYGEYHQNIERRMDLLRVQGVKAGHRLTLDVAQDADCVHTLQALLRIGVLVCPVSADAPETHRRFLHELFQAHGTVTKDGQVALTSNDPKPSQPALVVATSGSTGTPKLAVLALDTMNAAAAASNKNIALTPGERWLLSLPLYHVSGLSVLFRCALAGATVAIPPAGQDLATASTAYGATHVSVVALQLQRLLREGIPAGLKAVLLGGGPAPEALIRDALKAGVPLHTTYGLTEAGSQVTTTAPGADAAELLTSGSPLASVQVRIVDDEIQIAGPNLFEGYWHDGATDRSCFDGDWFPTGDLGRVDKAGRLHVIGRRDNMFVCGGENVQPETIEAALRAQPKVEEALVAPVADDEYGQRPVAFVRMEGNAEDLLARLRDALPAYLIPRTYHPWPEDLTAGGIKPRRADFQQRAEELNA
jgi:O-succinylbenzoic acid--CoA ligase